MGTISRDRLKQMIDDKEGFTLVDALPRKEYDSSHIPGALSLPVDELRDLAPKLLQDKDRKIVTYCGSTKCPASAKAAQALENLGYTDVHEYIEGKEDWKRAGFPLDGSEAAAREAADAGFEEQPDGEAEAVSSTTTEDIEAAHNEGYDAGVEQPEPPREF